MLFPAKDFLLFSCVIRVVFQVALRGLYDTGSTFGFKNPKGSQSTKQPALALHTGIGHAKVETKPPTALKGLLVSGHNRTV
jgi:hypothetical protein